MIVMILYQFPQQATLLQEKGSCGVLIPLRISGLYFPSVLFSPQWYAASFWHG